MIITDETYRDVLREKLRGRFRTIFRLEQAYCELPVRYPHPVRRESLGYYESPALAKEILRAKVEKDQGEDFLTLRVELQEIRLNETDGDVATRIFDRDGRMLALDSPPPDPVPGPEAGGV